MSQAEHALEDLMGLEWMSVVMLHAMYQLEACGQRKPGCRRQQILAGRSAVI